MSPALTALSLAGGVALLGLLVLDVFVTIFLPGSGAGPVTGRAYRATWWLWRQVTRRAGRHRRRLLGLCGPVLLPLTVLLWALELVVGFALVYLPFAGTFTVQGEPALPGWVTALYYSGYSATTLGVGDVYPQGGALRLVSVVESAFGFSLFSVSITYLISVYNAVAQSASFALGITRRFGPGGHGSVAAVLVAAQETGTVDDLRRWIEDSGAELERVATSRLQYPLLQYFHVAEDERAIPVALSDLLELLTVVQALPDPHALPALTRGPGVVAAFRSTAAYGQERAEPLGSEAEEAGPVREAREQSFAEAWSVLRVGGVPLRARDEAHHRYLELRSQWDVVNDALRRHFGYEPAFDRSR